jgi:glutathione S-transferase
MTVPELVGRSSSHFTRTARIFALELDVEHTFRPVLDIKSLDRANYAGNPTLKLPIFVDEHGPLFGTENICREITRRSGRASEVVMRGDLPTRVVANAEELTLHAMATDVSIIVAKMMDPDRPVSRKMLRSLEESLGELDASIDTVLAALPQRRISFVEVALFCVVTHRPFRETLAVSRWTRLGAFSESFGARASAQATTYRFDAA